jgi:multiple sugar transport system permease protein
MTMVMKVFRSPQRKRQGKGWTWQSLATMLMLVVLVYFLLPFFWLLVSATKTNQELFSTFGLWFAPDFNFWANLADLFSHDGEYS